MFRLAKCTAVQLSLLLNLLSTVGFAGRIERFPPCLLPSSTAVTQVDGRLIQYRVETGTLGIGHSRRDQRASATDAFGVGVSILLRNASLSERADNTAGSCPCCRANRRRGQPT